MRRSVMCHEIWPFSRTIRIFWYAETCWSLTQMLIESQLKSKGWLNEYQKTDHWETQLGCPCWNLQVLTQLLWMPAQLIELLKDS